MAVIARSTQIVPSAVTYLAHATLHRGYAMETGQGHVYLEGHDDNIERFVEAPAAKAKIAHLVSGFRDDTNSMNHMHLGSVPLIYFNNSAPSWWPASFGDSWKSLPNNSNPETTIGRQFWGDVCASYIVANFDDEAEFLEIDFTTSPALCSAYAYSDPNAPTDTRHSHAAPDDVRALEVLHWHHKIEDSNNLIMFFAMHKSLGRSRFIGAVQSTLYYERLFEPDIDHSNVQNTLWWKKSITGKSTVNGCLDQCAIDSYYNESDLKAVRFEPGTPTVPTASCDCFHDNMYGQQHRGQWKRVPDSNVQWFATTFAFLVRPDTHGRSMVWNRQFDKWYHGSPVGAGYILSSESVLQSYQLGQSSTPFDLLCREVRCHIRPTTPCRLELTSSLCSRSGMPQQLRL